MKHIVIVSLLFLVSVPVVAQAPAPTLTVDQKKDILLAAKDVENLELRLQIARATLQQVIASVVPAGYQLNEKLDLVKVEAKK